MITRMIIYQREFNEGHRYNQWKKNIIEKRPCMKIILRNRKILGVSNPQNSVSPGRGIKEGLVNNSNTKAM